jgi:hypothetical protein
MTKHEARWGWRQVGALVGVALGFAALVFALILPPSNLSRRNAAKVYGLLLHARLQQPSSEAASVPTVELGQPRIILYPERDQIVDGYVLNLHLVGQKFAIEAEPVQPGKTGTLYFYRSTDGVVRFNTFSPAGESSRPYVR